MTAGTNVANPILNVFEFNTAKYRFGASFARKVAEFKFAVLNETNV